MIILLPIPRSRAMARPSLKLELHPSLTFGHLTSFFRNFKISSCIQGLARLCSTSCEYRFLLSTFSHFVSAAMFCPCIFPHILLLDTTLQFAQYFTSSLGKFKVFSNSRMFLSATRISGFGGKNLDDSRDSI